MSIPFSISRSLVGELLFSISFVIMATGRKPQYLLRILFVIAIIVCLLLVLSNYSFFKVATSAITARFDSAASSEGGAQSTFTNRFLGGMISAFSNAAEHPFFGYGLGMGSNAGAQLLNGKRGFYISEEEWGRVIGEMGPFLGLSFIIIRLTMVFRMAAEGYKRVVKDDVLSWMLLSFGALMIAQGQWAQPTSQGFATLSAGLILAGLKKQQVVESTAFQQPN